MQEFLSNPMWQGIAGIVAIIALVAFFWAERKKKADISAETKPVSIEQRTYQILLDHVESFWIKGILEKSLHGAALMELNIQENHQAVNYPWTVHRERDNKLISSDKAILDIFQDVGMGRSMLILGEPGSGKTTMLLELVRQLIYIARHNDKKPIPIVLNLSSWSDKQSIKDWLTEQLNSFYKVDKRIAQVLLETNKYILLLDGLDEVKKEFRNACIKIINDFRNERGLIQIAICCRSEEYADLDIKLDFEGAITIQSLTPEKVDKYFDRFGNRLAGIRNLLKKDTTLRELTQTPLMLSVMTLAYLDMPGEDIQIDGEIEYQRKQIFNTYINRMFERPGRAQNNQFSKERTLHWLSCLARLMIQQNEVPFLIENLQPKWLEKGSQQSTYSLSVRIISGLIVGLIVGLVGGLIVALVVGMLFKLFFRLDLTIIEPVSVLSWSWTEIKKGLRINLVGGLVTGLVVGLVVGLAGGLVVVLSGLTDGLSPRQIEKTTFPNQNIMRSVRNFLITFLLFGLVGGLVVGLVGGLVGALFGGLVDGLVVGLAGGLYIGLFGGLDKGGISVIQHYVLRYFITYRNHYLPWHLIPFLDHSSDLILLRKIGGGYIFVHRLLMEHFADMEV